MLTMIPAAKAQFVPVEDPKELSARLLAPKGLYPGAAFLLRQSSQGNHTCSAVIVAPQWAVTQAYCVATVLGEGVVAGSNPPSEYSLGYGSTTFAAATMIGVEKFVLSGRPADAGNAIDYGLALVKLATPVPVPPTEIAEHPALGEAPSEATTGGAVVVGWGRFFLEEPAGALVNQRHLSVRIMPREECVAVYGDKVANTAFCAKSAFASIDACDGFGGAPLLVPATTGKFIVQGLVSWGAGDCTKSAKPHVYTDLAHYRSWIAETIGPLPSASAPAAARSAAPNAPSEPPVDTKSPEFQTRVVGPASNLAPTGLFRSMVSLGLARQNQALGHFCGGSLITRGWVLTAAHCVDDLKGNPAALQLKIDSDLLSRGGVLLRAKRIIVHAGYVPPRASEPPQNDIALIEVDGMVPTDIVPLAIMDPPAEAAILGAREDATVVGWGKNAFSAFGKTSDHLHWTTVKLLQNAACNAPVRYAGHISERQMCAGNDFADSCQGDSGGPLLTIDDSQEFVLIGIVSWGDGCAKPDKPGVYVRLSGYVDWIEATIRAQSTPPR